VRVIDHTVRERFPAGAVVRAELLQHGDDPATGPGQLMVRVVVAEHGAADVMGAWVGIHRSGWTNSDVRRSGRGDRRCDA
jgi:hypothetical protein